MFTDKICVDYWQHVHSINKKSRKNTGYRRGNTQNHILDLCDKNQLKYIANLKNLLESEAVNVNLKSKTFFK